MRARRLIEPRQQRAMCDSIVDPAPREVAPRRRWRAGQLGVVPRAVVSSVRCDLVGSGLVAHRHARAIRAGGEHGGERDRWCGGPAIAPRHVVGRREPRDQPAVAADQQAASEPLDRPQVHPAQRVLDVAPGPRVIDRDQQLAAIAGDRDRAVRQQTDRLEICAHARVDPRVPRAIRRARDEPALADDDPRALAGDREPGQRLGRPARGRADLAIAPAPHHAVTAEHHELVAHRVHARQPYGGAEVDPPHRLAEHAGRVARLAHDPDRAIAAKREREQAALGPGLEHLPSATMIARHRELAVLAAHPQRISDRERIAQPEPTRRGAGLEVTCVGRDHHHRPAIRRTAERDDPLIGHRKSRDIASRVVCVLQH